MSAPALSLATKTAYGIGQVAEGVKNGAFNIFLFFYFNQVLGLSGASRAWRCSWRWSSTPSPIR